MEPLDRLETLTTDIIVRQKYNERNRFSLLMVHAIKGVTVGISIIKYGGPTTFTVNQDSQYLLGFAAFLGGTLLFVGLVNKRDTSIESAGMVILLGWDSFMTGGFIYLFYKDTTSASIFYPIFIYGAFACFMVIHLYTLYKFISWRVK